MTEARVGVRRVSSVRTLPPCSFSPPHRCRARGAGAGQQHRPIAAQRDACLCRARWQPRSAPPRAREAPCSAAHPACAGLHDAAAYAHRLRSAAQQQASSTKVLPPRGCSQHSSRRAAARGGAAASAASSAALGAKCDFAASRPLSSRASQLGAGGCEQHGAQHEQSGAALGSGRGLGGSSAERTMLSCGRWAQRPQGTKDALRGRSAAHARRPLGRPACSSAEGRWGLQRPASQRRRQRGTVQLDIGTQRGRGGRQREEQSTRRRRQQAAGGASTNRSSRGRFSGAPSMPRGLTSALGKRQESCGLRELPAPAAGVRSGSATLRSVWGAAAASRGSVGGGGACASAGMMSPLLLRLPGAGTSYLPSAELQSCVHM